MCNFTSNLINNMKRYCKKCGFQLNEFDAPAENYADVELYKITPFAPANPEFDTKTGKKLFVKAYQCPNRNRKVFWFNITNYEHDSFSFEKSFTK